MPQVGSENKNYNTLKDIENDVLYDFIVNGNGEFVIGRGHYKLNKKKDSLFFAGRMKVKNGLIYYIDNDSGHYSPSKTELCDFYEILKTTKYAHENIQFSLK